MANLCEDDVDLSDINVQLNVVIDPKNRRRSKVKATSRPKCSKKRKSSESDPTDNEDKSPFTLPSVPIEDLDEHEYGTEFREFKFLGEQPLNSDLLVQQNVLNQIERTSQQANVSEKRIENELKEIKVEVQTKGLNDLLIMDALPDEIPPVKVASFCDPMYTLEENWEKWFPDEIVDLFDFHIPLTDQQTILPNNLPQLNQIALRKAIPIDAIPTNCNMNTVQTSDCSERLKPVDDMIHKPPFSRSSVSEDSNQLTDSNSQFIEVIQSENTIMYVHISDGKLRNFTDVADTHISVKLFKCSLCRKFYSQKEIINLSKLKPAITKSYVCKICNKSRKENIIIRKKSCNMRTIPKLTQIKKSHFCRICNKIVPHIEHFNIHIRNHTGKKLDNCEYCAKSFARRGNFKRHILSHIIEKPFKCKTCAKSFFRKNDLEKHNLLHTGKKPKTCNTCKKSFSRIDSLKRHIRIHTGEKPYKCELCEKSFSDISNRNQHILTHTGEKPCICETCKKSFTRKSSLKKHKLIHSRMQPLS